MERSRSTDGEAQPGSPMALHSAMSTESLHLELPLLNPDPPAFVPAPGDSSGGAAAPRDAGEALHTPGRSSSLFLPCDERSGVEVYAWGRSDCGQLGTGGDEDSPNPRPVATLAAKDVVAVAAGALHSSAVVADGECYTWGLNDEGQGGVRGQDKAMLPSPTRVSALENFRIRLAACGAAHTLAVAEDGGVFAFGAADYGQLGIGAAASKVEQPRPVRALRESRIARVAAGGRHSLALGCGGELYAFGDGSAGALGLGSTESADAPRRLLRPWPLGITQVAAGDSHSAALTVGGAVLTWGRGKSGQLGLGSFESCQSPTPVPALHGGPAAVVSCGAEHTVVLTHTGEVYATGQGKWGQTGHGALDNVCTLRQVAALEGQRIVHVSAGGRHTLFLSAGGEVWACGCNDNGQAGAPAGGNVATPRVVQGLPACSAVLCVEAGGDHSFAVLQRGSSAEGAAAEAKAAHRPNGEVWLPLPLPPLAALVAEAQASGAGAQQQQDGKVKAVVNAVERVFSNPAFLLHALSRPAGSAGEPAGGGEAAMEVDDGAGSDDAPAAGAEHAAAPGPNPPPAAAVLEGGRVLDVPFIGRLYQDLLKLYSADVAAALGTACIRLLDTMERYLNAEHPAVRAKRAPTAAELDRPLLTTLAWVAPTLFALLQCPLAGDARGYGAHIVLRLGRILSATLPAEQRIPVRRALQGLLALLPADAFAARCVRPVQRYLDALVSSGRAGSGRVEVLMAGVLLDVLRQANEDAGGRVPESEFYNKALSSAVDLESEYLAWIRHREAAPQALVSLCQMPFLLTPEAKARVLHGEAALQKQQSMSAAALQAFFQGGNAQEAGFLRLAVRRSNVVEDALNGLLVHQHDLKKPLKVTFVSGGVPEPAQDEGGVRKEFFQLLCRDLFRPEYGMFQYDEATRTHWFALSSVESESEYELVGAALGLAIYNAVLLDVRFPLVVYKKLLGGRPTFADLRDAFPELGRGLQALLEYEPAGEVEAVFCRAFEAEYEFFGEVRSQELVPGGARIPVTGDNRAAYVDAYTRWVLDDAVGRQFGAFARGFLRVCGGPALTLFTPAELELLVCGLPHLDFDGLQAGAVYDGGYTAQSQAVSWFWSIVRGMSLEQKRQLLAFTTGSDRAPVGGLAKLHFCVQRAGPDTERLPTSHTCFNVLLLPEYASQEKMRERLLTAVGNAQGFGLQ